VQVQLAGVDLVLDARALDESSGLPMTMLHRVEKFGAEAEFASDNAAGKTRAVSITVG